MSHFVSITTVVIIVTAGSLGILGRWLNLWKQKRTASTFKQYLFEDPASTLQSFIANLVSSSMMVSSLPIDSTFSLIMSTAWGAFGVGYGIDSRLNKDTNPSVQINSKAVTLHDLQNLMDSNSK